LHSFCQTSFRLESNLIYDLGLHKGEDTAFYLRKGYNVIAVEANPELVVHCKDRFRDELERGQLRIIEGAIAPASAGDTITLFRNRKSVWSTIDERWAERNAKLGEPSQRIEVPRVDVGDVYHTFGVPFYLKIDVEGADRIALEELKILEARPQYVSIESEKVDFSNLLEELELLLALGFRKFKAVQQQEIPGRKIKTKSLDGAEFEYVFEENATGPFGEDIPQPWLTFDEVVEEYERIFTRYRHFGDNSEFNNMPWYLQEVITTLYSRGAYRGPLPGWHDTHATL